MWREEERKCWYISKLFALWCSLRLLRFERKLKCDKENWMCMCVSDCKKHRAKKDTDFICPVRWALRDRLSREENTAVCLHYPLCVWVWPLIFFYFIFFAVVFIGLLCHNMCQWAPAELLTILRAHAPQLGIISHYFKQIGVNVGVNI